MIPKTLTVRQLCDKRNELERKLHNVLKLFVNETGCTFTGQFHARVGQSHSVRDVVDVSVSITAVPPETYED